MKHINDNPFEFFQQGGWSFLGGAGGAEVGGPCSLGFLTFDSWNIFQSEHSSDSDSVSEFEAGSDGIVSSSGGSSVESDYSNASGSGSGSGSDFGGGDDSDEGKFGLLACK